MKIFKEGILKNENSFEIDLEKDSENDIINTVSSTVYKTKFFDNCYYYGYQFLDSASQKDRSLFINWIKSKDIKDMSNSLKSFIIKPLKAIDDELDLNSFDIVLSPKSGRSNLVPIMRQIATEYLSRDINKKTYEFFKNSPIEVSFDWEQFLFDNADADSNTINQIKNYVDNVLMPSIYSKDYFSIAQSVKPRYRKYIENYLVFGGNLSLLSNIGDGKILIIDDINTSGSTLSEMLRIIRSVNKRCLITIFTLIGKN